MASTQKIFHVFISSTFVDLQDERSAVRDAVSKAGFVCEGMELFPASSQKQLDFIERVIDRCDYYVIILGGRYGSVDAGGVSYTEREYEYARTRGIPILAFLHRDIGKLQAERVESDPAIASKLEDLRDRLKSSQLVDHWRDAQGLATAVAVALAQEVNLNPGIGWVRGDMAADPKLYEELERARTTINELRGDGDLSFPSDVAAPDATFHVEVNAIIHHRNNNSERKVIPVTETWETAFVSVSNELHEGGDETDTVSQMLVKAMRRNFTFEEGDQIFVENKKELRPLFRIQFEALGLIRTDTVTETQERVVGTTYSQRVVWKLTEKGRRYLAKALAVRPASDHL